MESEVNDKRIEEALLMLEQGKSFSDVKKEIPEISETLQMLNNLKQKSSKLKPSEELLERTLLRVQEQDIKNENKTNFKNIFIMNKKIYAGALAVILLAVVVGGAFFFAPKIEEQRQEKKFVIDIEDYAFGELDEFTAETEEIELYMDDDQFQSLETDLLALANLDLEGFEDEEINDETEENSNTSISELEMLLEEIGSELESFEDDSNELINLDSDDLGDLENDLSSLGQT